MRTGARVSAITRDETGWRLLQEPAHEAQSPQHFDRIILACPPAEAARLALTSALPCQPWVALAQGLSHEAIATVYAMVPGARLPLPMLALHASEGWPAQFVFDRGQLGGPAGLLAFVISASDTSSAVTAEQVQQQAAAQLGLRDLQVLQTIVEKRATFACTPGLQRPAMHVAANLLACGDYVAGPYPATLEGAVLSGLAAARTL